MQTTYEFKGRVNVSNPVSERALRKFLREVVVLDVDTESHGVEVAKGVNFDGIELDYSTLREIDE